MAENHKNQFNFQDVTAMRKVFALSKRIRGVSGGTSASKTISILVWLIDYCQRRQDRIKLATVGAESLPHLKQGAMLDFEMIMKDRGYWNDDRFNKSERIYTFETGNKMQFTSFDTYGKAHGPRRDILFLNEANNLPYNIADQLITRTREIVWLDWNPSNEFWFYTEMLERRSDVDFITLTYKDNEALDKTTISEIESHMGNRSWWTVYGLGQLGVLENRIFSTWKVDYEAIPPEAKLIRYGLDFGYSNDPTALVAIYKWNNSYLLDEITYLKGLSNKDIADILLNLPRALVIADSSEPKSIDEIKSYGVNILPAVKGKDSVNQGIQYMQEQVIGVTKRSVNGIKEYRNYLWMTDKDGKVINEPQDFLNHFLDAVRYGMDSATKSNTFVMRKDVGGVTPFLPGMKA